MRRRCSGARTADAVCVAADLFLLLSSITLSRRSSSQCPLALNHQAVSMCESSLSLSGSITHPLCLSRSLVLSPQSHWLYLSYNSYSLSPSPTCSSLVAVHDRVFVTLHFSVSLSLNYFHIHFWHGTNASSHGSAFPHPLSCVSSQIPPFIRFSLVGRGLADGLTHSGQSDGPGLRPSALHSSATSHNREQTLQKNTAPNTKWCTEWDDRRKKEKSSGEGEINNTSLCGERLQSLSSLCSRAKINAAAYQREWKLL